MGVGCSAPVVPGGDDAPPPIAADLAPRFARLSLHAGDVSAGGSAPELAGLTLSGLAAATSSAPLSPLAQLAAGFDQLARGAPLPARETHVFCCSKGACAAAAAAAANCCSPVPGASCRCRGDAAAWPAAA